MTIFNMRCDRCDRAITGPSRPFEPGSHRGVRFAYHPGDQSFADNSTLVCVLCWREIDEWLGPDPSPTTCAVCGIDVDSSLHIQAGETEWRLCVADAVAFLNRLLTVEPKLDPATFVLPSA